MAYRTETNANDHRIYARTASKVKKININPKASRGGIRL